MKKIGKYQLHYGQTTLEMQAGAKIISAQLQYGVLCLWAITGTYESVIETRHFEVIGTGIDFDDTNLKHVTTYQDGEFVWHLFEKVIL